MSQPQQQNGPIAASAITPVILCGGSGTRLWPLSTPEAPKPFLPLVGETSLFQETLARCRDSGFAPPVIVTGAAHVEQVREQSRGFDVAEIIVEPRAKQTAAAIALAAERLPADAIMLVCPSDHHIADREAFAGAVLSGAGVAASGMLVCVTVTATSPETGFGYVRPGGALQPGGFKVASFVEKPDRATAVGLIDEGAAWNAGIFLFAVGTYADELKLHRPNIANTVLRAVRDGTSDGICFHPGAAFAEIDPESVDYAVMENTSRAAMVEAQMGWSDIGNWQMLHLAREKDGDGNSVRGQARLIGCRNVAVQSDGPRVHCLGVENLVVVTVGQDFLVMPLDAASEIGKVRLPDA